jgi:LCP family protein required for cell wall assembly
MRDGVTRQDGTGEAAGSPAGPDDHGWDDSLYNDRAVAGRHTLPQLADGQDGASLRRAGERAPRSRRRRILRWAAITVSLTILGTAGAGWAYYQHLNGNLGKGKRSSGGSDVAKPKADSKGQTPINILLIGSDSRNSAADLKLGGSKQSVGAKPLADVQMLVHLSADRRNMSVVSIPRDTRVHIPECEDPKTHQKYAATTNSIINETLGRGGPGCTLDTWQNLTGVYIDHWMVIDFAGVVQMADAVGGVEVCVKQPVWDRPLPGVPGGSGLKIKAGKQKVYGRTALQWLRTRHAFFDDLGRAQAQHMYLNSMIRQLKSRYVFTDTGRLLGLAETATSALDVSEEIGTVRKLGDLAMQLKSVPSNRITMTTMPVVQDQQNLNHLVPKGADAARIWSMIRNDISFDANGKAKTATGGTSGATPTSSAAPPGPSAAPAATIPVSVVNGTAGGSGIPVNGRAGALAKTLADAGFSKAAANPTQQPSAGTVLSYPAKDGGQGKADALAVAAILKLPKNVVKKSVQVSSITLLVGADWRAGTDYSKTLPSAGSVPSSARAINGSDKNACMDVYKPYVW